MENNNNGNYGQDGRNPKENTSYKFSPLNIGSIDYNTSNNDLEPHEEDVNFEDEENFEKAADGAFRTHAL